MPIGKFGLEKTWRSEGVGSYSFNAPGNFTVPFGKSKITVSGKGGTGNAEVSSTVASYNASTVASYNSPSPGSPVLSI